MPTYPSPSSRARREERRPAGRSPPRRVRATGTRRPNASRAAGQRPGRRRVEHDRARANRRSRRTRGAPGLVDERLQLRPGRPRMDAATRDPPRRADDDDAVGVRTRLRAELDGNAPAVDAVADAVDPRCTVAVASRSPGVHSHHGPLWVTLEVGGRLHVVAVRPSLSESCCAGALHVGRVVHLHPHLSPVSAPRLLTRGRGGQWPERGVRRRDRCRAAGAADRRGSAGR